MGLSVFAQQMSRKCHGAGLLPGLLLGAFWLLHGSTLDAPVRHHAEPKPASGKGTAAWADATGRPSIVLITVDTLRADHLGIYGYNRATSPYIDAWFASGHVYEAAYATEAYTAPSIMSLFTGMLPQQHGVRLLYQKIRDDVATLPDRLRASGYQTAAVVSSIVLTSEAMGLDTRFDYYNDYVDEREPYRQVHERRASRTTDAAIAWLRHGRDPNRPHFLWVHYIDPHGPYHPPSDKPTDFDHPTVLPIDVSRIPEYQREPGIDNGLEYVDRYDEEIAYTDREIGRLLETYTTLGLAERSVFVFTSDHGESMMEHEEWFRHGYQVYEEIVRVPLLVRAPGLVPSRIDHPVSLADVTPTILLTASLDVPAGLYGQSLFKQIPGRAIYSEASGSGASPHQWRAMWQSNGKWIVKVERTRSRLGRVVRSLFGWEPLIATREAERRYYDLMTDPAELHPKPWPDGALAAPLLELVRDDPDPAGFPRQMDYGLLLRTPKIAPQVAEEDLERLRALGYVR